MDNKKSMSNENYRNLTNRYAYIKIKFENQIPIIPPGFRKLHYGEILKQWTDFIILEPNGILEPVYRISERSYRPDYDGKIIRKLFKIKESEPDREKWESV
jgi:hypothetical protein